MLSCGVIGMTPEEFMQRERDVREAIEAFPNMEMGEAYNKFMTEIKRKPPAPKLSSGDRELKAIKSHIKSTLRRKCNQQECNGEQVLQGVCDGCAAGKKGFKTVWECQECLVREYSTRPYFEWFEELNGKGNGA